MLERIDLLFTLNIFFLMETSTKYILLEQAQECATVKLSFKKILQFEDE